MNDPANQADLPDDILVGLPRGDGDPDVYGYPGQPEPLNYEEVDYGKPF